MNEPIHLPDDLQRALKILCNATPPVGMQARIVERLRERRMQKQFSIAPIRFGSALSPWKLAAIGAIATACAMIFVLARTQLAPPGPVVAQFDFPLLPNIVALPALSTPPLRARLDQTPHHTTVPLTASPAIRATPLSFPAPRMPLTHQEQLLLSIARLSQPQVDAVMAFLAHPEPPLPPERKPNSPSNEKILGDPQ